MSTNKSERLFYVVKESDTTYSLYSIQTDHLILAEVAANAISDFLFLNEPNNPALSKLKTASFHDLYSDNKHLKDTLNYYANLFTYDFYNPYDQTEVTQWGTATLNNLTLDESDKQLSFDFSSELNQKKDTNNFIVNFSDSLINASDNQKSNYPLTNSITNSSELYVVKGNTDGPKTQYSPNSEWKELNIDDD